MEWLPGVKVEFNNTLHSLETLIYSFTETGSGVYNKFIDLLLLPLAAFLLGVIESGLKFLLEEGEFEKYELATTQSYYSAISWLELSKFQSKLIS